MLILAGVSLNAIVGDNGILTMAQKAKIESEKAQIIEDLDTELISYNANAILNEAEKTEDMLNNLMSKGIIDSVLTSTGEYVTDAKKAIGIPQFDDDNKYTGYLDYAIKKGEHRIVLSVDNEGIYKAEFGEINMSTGGSVSAGTTVVTGDVFNSSTNSTDKGKFTIEGDASIMFVDEVGGEFSFVIKSGTHAKINIFKDMTLTNKGVSRSAIDIEPGGILDLWIAKEATVTVDSGFGDTGATAEGTRAGGGNGGYAGIHVPKFEEYNKVQVISYDKVTQKDIIKTNPVGSSTLNVGGDGTLICYGGRAGNGGAALSGTCGGGRRWSEPELE